MEGSKISSFDSSTVFETLPGVSPEDFKVWRVGDAPECSKAVRFVDRYFEDKKKGRTFNQRRDLSPFELATYLPYVTILEPIYSDAPANSPTDVSADIKTKKEEAPCIVDACFRLVGTKIVSLYGEATGKLVSEHHGSEILERVRKIANFCIHEKSSAVGKSAALAHGRTRLEVTLLYVPFSEDDTHVNQLFIFADICRIDVAGNRQPGDRLPEALSAAASGISGERS